MKARLLGLFTLAASCASTPESPAETARTAVSDEGPIAAQVAHADAQLDAIASLDGSRRNFANTVEALDDVIAEFFMTTRMQSFLSNVSTDAEERDLGRATSAPVGDWFSAFNKRRDLFEALRVVEDSNLDLDEEEAELLESMLRDFRREGMSLNDADRERLVEIDSELNELGIEFRKNIADDRTQLLLTRDELGGCDEEFIESLPRSDALFIVRTSGPNIRHIGTYCTNETTRLKLGAATGQRAGMNIAVLERLLALRLEKALLLGFETTADYETEPRMAKNAEAVWKFYDDLRPKLRKKAERDFAEFEAAKREHLGDPKAQLNAWDVRFYQNWLLREKYAVDSQEVVQYFPIEAVTQGLFDITQKLYGVEYRDISDRARSEGRPMWHEDVKLFEVWEVRDEELLGEFYLDLHPRPGKYNHAAQFPLVIRKEWSNGELSRPLVALVCNFTKPTATKPSLLTHSEVETFFHEFGHCLHSIFTKARFLSLAGTSVARDFVEAPSQMFENWVWNADVLGGFARHFETGEALPADLIARLVAAKNLGSGLSTEGQVYLGLMDFTFHTQATGDVDTSAIRRDVYEKARLFSPLDNSLAEASFGHLVGYQAGYYGYLWSLVYASDMFSRFEGDLMNAETAREYRDKILSRGSTRDELDMVIDFLGREPTADAFLRYLGLDG